LNTLKVIGSTIKTERLRQNLTLRDVAELSYTSLGYLSEVERGQKEVSFNVLESICNALVYPLPKLLQMVATSLEEVASESTNSTNSKMSSLSR